jgi:hypothetical protein
MEKISLVPYCAKKGSPSANLIQNTDLLVAVRSHQFLVPHIDHDVHAFHRDCAEQYIPFEQSMPELFPPGLSSGLLPLRKGRTPVRGNY